MVDIRLMGSSEEIRTTLEKLKEVVEVISVSKDYPNRGNGDDVRVYVKANVV